VRLARSLPFAALSLLICSPAVCAVILPTFTVNSTADIADANPGDGFCDTIASPEPHDRVCTLRAAVMEANKTANAVIYVPSGTYLLSIPRLSCALNDACGDLNLTASMGIYRTGSGPVILDATGLDDRIFQIPGGPSITLSGLTLQHAHQGYGEGGCIYSAGALDVIDGTLDDCVAIYRRGGAVAQYGGTLTLTRTTITSSSAQFGGGLYVYSASVTLTDSTISGCSGSVGGGLYIEGTNPSATIVRSAIAGNSANYTGGGIYTNLSSIGLSCTLINSTITGNHAAEDGGGIYHGSGTMRLFSTTVANNQADSDFNGTGQGGGVFNGTGATLTFVDSLIAANAETFLCGFPSCSPDRYVSTDGDCAGTIASQGYSMLRNYDTTHCTVTGVFTLDDPKLDDLRSNGGLTRTLALLPGSPAIDMGNPSGCTDQNGGPLSTDQRGVKRTVGAACDMGAFEVEPKGDANGDGFVNVADVFYFINYLFAGGPPPRGRANVNNDSVISVADVFYLINYLFAGGPPPV
jgi:CSLREA domain-containing protein